MKRRSDERQIRFSAAQFRAEDREDAHKISGYFSVFGDTYDMWPDTTESIDPHAFDGALNDDIRALIDHETRLVLGRTTAGTLRLRVDNHGLLMSLSPPHPGLSTRRRSVPALVLPSTRRGS